MHDSCVDAEQSYSGHLTETPARFAAGIRCPINPATSQSLRQPLNYRLVIRYEFAREPVHQRCNARIQRAALS